jgi:ubiquinone/menaquinone biosynthesis C-methylase UbiE
MEVMFGARQPYALRSALELDFFTAISDGNRTAEAIARSRGCAVRGARVLCDFLTVSGFLEKRDGEYSLTPESAMFLTRNSPAYLGDAVQFYLSPQHSANWDRLTDSVRNGGNRSGPVVNDPSLWVRFARGMAPLSAPVAKTLAERLRVAQRNSPRILDIAASHGEYGIAILRANPNARLVAIDFTEVLEVTRERAIAAGVVDRATFLPGDAFELDFEGPYDVIVFPNFLHHFDPPTNERFLKKVRGALSPQGEAATVEFVPNEDRVSPAPAAAFALQMLSSTAAGDAYTARELQEMFHAAGFPSVQVTAEPPSPYSLVIAGT